MADAQPFVLRKLDLTPLIDRPTAIELLRGGVANGEEFLLLLEDAKGCLRFRAGLTRGIKNLKIENYPLLYENERSTGVALAKAIASDVDLAELETELQGSTPEERGEAVKELGALVCCAMDFLELPDETTPEQEEVARAALDALPPEERARSNPDVPVLAGSWLGRVTTSSL